MDRHCNQPLRKFNSGGYMILYACRVCGYGYHTMRERAGEEYE